MIRFIGLVGLIVGISACDNSIVGPSPIRSSDTVSYRVIGTNIVGSVLIDYATPTTVISITSNLAVPFTTGSIVGFNQLVSARPTITVTVIQSGCVEAQILINALIERRALGCGPGTFTAIR